jgi:hypothetical protein
MRKRETVAHNEVERRQVEEAVERLITGHPHCSDGSHTVVTLAKESGVERTRLYEQYPELITDFKRRTQQALSPRIINATSRELATAHERVDELAAENARLRERIRTLSAVITELSIQNDRDNVIHLRP